MEWTHVYPLNDFKDHETESGPSCWCKPEVDGDLVIHNALDEREKIENGEREIQ